MKPFLQGKKAIDNKLLRITQSPMVVAAPGGGAHEAHGGPNVETIKQGDKIVRLIVTCTCGERIEVDCLYPAGK